MLREKYPREILSKLLLNPADWHPFPPIDEREPWESLDESIRTGHVGQAEEHLGAEWPFLPASKYLGYARTGNRSEYEGLYFKRREMLGALVIGECVEGEGGFIDDIVNGVWAICEESSWVVPAHNSAKDVGVGLPDSARPSVDLFAADTSALLAWVDYLVRSKFDEVSPLIRPRIRREITLRIFEPCLESEDYWWMGFLQNRRLNNWTPWICSNWLASALLIESDNKTRLNHVVKVMQCLDFFLGPYPQDGGCDEGPGYWGRAGASVFDCLEILHDASGGQIDVYGEPLIQEMGRFIARAHIADNYFINFADAGPLVRPDGLLTYRYGRRIGDKKLAAFGAWCVRQQGEMEHGISIGGMTSLSRVLPGLFLIREAAESPAEPVYPKSVWLKEIQVMAARDEEASTIGFYLAAKGGHNSESHNHNDVGHFVVYIDGRPLLIDPGVLPYTAKTFSDQRYEIWNNQSGYHNVPTIGGEMQSNGAEFAALSVQHSDNGETASLRLDIAAAYPPEAGINSWLRTLSLRRGESISLEDEWRLDSTGRKIEMNLMTPCRVQIEDGQLQLHEQPIDDDRRTSCGIIDYDANLLDARIEEMHLEEGSMKATWGSLTRIVLVVKLAEQEGKWSLMIRR